MTRAAKLVAGSVAAVLVVLALVASGTTAGFGSSRSVSSRFQAGTWPTATAMPGLTFTLTIEQSAKNHLGRGGDGWPNPPGATPTAGWTALPTVTPTMVVTPTAPVTPTGTPTIAPTTAPAESPLVGPTAAMSNVP